MDGKKHSANSRGSEGSEPAVHDFLQEVKNE